MIGKFPGWILSACVLGLGAATIAPAIANPSLVIDKAGDLYGTTSGGYGNACDGSGCGTAFKLVPQSNGTYVDHVLRSFNDADINGITPIGGLIVDKSGNLYGASESGSGATGVGCDCGNVYRLTLQSNGAYGETLLHIFGDNGNDGVFPEAPVTMDASGALYGTTEGGGNVGCSNDPNPGCGTVFKLTPATGGYTYSILHRFGGTNDGQLPQSTIYVDKSGAVYGTTREGGTTGTCYDPTVATSTHCGIVFKLTPGATGYTETILHEFAGGVDGAEPATGLVADSSGALYGTTSEGGKTSCPDPNGFVVGCGTIYKLTPSGTSYAESAIYPFKGGADGSAPLDTLIVDGSGRLYGTTAGGGNTACQGGCGTVFQMIPNGSTFTETRRFDFLGNAHKDGSSPVGGLLVGPAGAFYGTTTYGGGTSCIDHNGITVGCGTAIKLTLTSTGFAETVLYRFKGGSDGTSPNARPLRGIRNIRNLRRR